jgi:hypothetical protein
MRRSSPFSRRGLGDGLREDHLGERAHQAVDLGEREELAGAEEPAHRVLPPDQGFHAHGVAGRDVELRLVVEDQLALGQCGAQVLDQGQVTAAVGVP